MTRSYNATFTFDSEVLIREAGAGACIAEGGQGGGVTSTNYVIQSPLPLLYQLVTSKRIVMSKRSEPEQRVWCTLYCSQRVESDWLWQRRRERERDGWERQSWRRVYLFSCQLTVDNGGLYAHIIAFISRFIRPALGTVTSFQFPVKQLSMPNKYCVICFT